MDERYSKRAVNIIQHMAFFLITHCDKGQSKLVDLRLCQGVSVNPDIICAKPVGYKRSLILKNTVI